MEKGDLPLQCFQNVPRILPTLLIHLSCSLGGHKRKGIEDNRTYEEVKL